MTFFCSKCDKEFKYQSRLNEHLNIKNSCDKPKEDLKCELCNITFDRKLHKYKHIKTNKHQKKQLIKFFNKIKQEININ